MVGGKNRACDGFFAIIDIKTGVVLSDSWGGGVADHVRGVACVHRCACGGHGGGDLSLGEQIGRAVRAFFDVAITGVGKVAATANACLVAAGNVYVVGGETLGDKVDGFAVNHQFIHRGGGGGCGVRSCDPLAGKGADIALNATVRGGYGGCGWACGGAVKATAATATTATSTQGKHRGGQRGKG